jgi:hypothetical protein
MSGGTIQGNAAYNGGGVYVSGSGSTFTMDGGTIKGNTTYTSSSSNGGGVYVSGGSTFFMTGGTIEGNTATICGGGVYVTNSSGNTFTKTGGTIYGDNNNSHDDSNGSTENTATSGNGHAVYLYGGNQRNATSPANHNLYAEYVSGSGWSYIHPTLGDTSGKWPDTVP